MATPTINFCKDSIGKIIADSQISEALKCVSESCYKLEILIGSSSAAAFVDSSLRSKLIDYSESLWEIQRLLEEEFLKNRKNETQKVQ